MMSAVTRPAAASAAAQLLWTTLRGPDVDRDAAALLDRGIGGVVLFSRNITSAAGLRELTAELRRRAGRPLPIAIDHEGGHVARIGAPLTRWPSAMAIAATGAPALAREVAAAAAAELAAVGIDVNLAPVVDVAADPANPAIGARSFGSDPELVGRFAGATIAGMRAGGVASVAKHFPGHGRTPVDSHRSLPILDGGREALEATDLPPFNASIRAGVDAVMVSHVAVPGVGSGDRPATLDPAIVAGLLRRELSFDRLVVTDALGMGAVTERSSVAEASLASLVAGVDVALPGEDEGEALDLLDRAWADGRLSARDIEARRARIATFHAALRALRPPPVDREANARLAARVASGSLTLVRGADLLPIPRGTRLVLIDLPTRRASPVEEPGTPETTLGERLRARWPHVVEHRVADTLDGTPVDAVLRDVADADLVLVATRDAFAHPDDRALVDRLRAVGRPTILLALRSPHDLDALGPSDGAIAAYADVPASLEALAAALDHGPDAFPGVLPMRTEATA